MPAKDLFDKPFDEGTLYKLKVFEDYFKEWLPVFISPHKPIRTEVQIFDFFAGAGKDCNNVSGIPSIILSTISKNGRLIKASNLKIRLYSMNLTKVNLKSFLI